MALRQPRTDEARRFLAQCKQEARGLEGKGQDRSERSRVDVRKKAAVESGGCRRGKMTRNDGISRWVPVSFSTAQRRIRVERGARRTRRSDPRKRPCAPPLLPLAAQRMRCPRAPCPPASTPWPGEPRGVPLSLSRSSPTVEYRGSRLCPRRVRSGQSRREGRRRCRGPADKHRLQAIGMKVGRPIRPISTLSEARGAACLHGRLHPGRVVCVTAAS